MQHAVKIHSVQIISIIFKYADKLVSTEINNTSICRKSGNLLFRLRQKRTERNTEKWKIQIQFALYIIYNINRHFIFPFGLCLYMLFVFQLKILKTISAFRISLKQLTFYLKQIYRKLRKSFCRSLFYHAVHIV